MILLIHKDTTFRAGLAALLKQDGHVVQEHTQSRQLPALDTLGEVSLAIIDHDHATQRGNGLDLVDAFHKAHPDTPVLILTSYWSLRLAGDAAARPFVRLLRKPISCEDLRALVRDVGVAAT